MKYASTRKYNLGCYATVDSVVMQCKKIKWKELELTDVELLVHCNAENYKMTFPHPTEELNELNLTPSNFQTNLFMFFVYINRYYYSREKGKNGISGILAAD